MSDHLHCSHLLSCYNTAPSHQMFLYSSELSSTKGRKYAFQKMRWVWYKLEKNTEDTVKEKVAEHEWGTKTSCGEMWLLCRRRAACRKKSRQRATRWERQTLITQQWKSISKVLQMLFRRFMAGLQWRGAHWFSHNNTFQQYWDSLARHDDIVLTLPDCKIVALLKAGQFFSSSLHMHLNKASSFRA